MIQGSIKYKNKFLNLKEQAEPHFVIDTLCKIIKDKKTLEVLIIDNFEIKFSSKTLIKYELFKENNEWFFKYKDNRNNFISIFSLSEISKLYDKHKDIIDDIIYDVDNQEDSYLLSKSFEELKKERKYLDEDNELYHNIFLKIYKKIEG